MYFKLYNEFSKIDKVKYIKNWLWRRKKLNVRLLLLNIFTFALNIFLNKDDDNKIYSKKILLLLLVTIILSIVVVVVLLINK